MLQWAGGLRVACADLYLDSPSARARCFVSHAHSDHLGLHEQAICTPATAALAEHRVGLRDARLLEYRESHPLDRDGGTTIRLLPAGHVLGSAMLEVVSTGGTLLYTGDFKLRPCLTAEPAEVSRADVLVMECTYGRPLFRFPPRALIEEELLDRVRAALREGRQPIVMGYSLGKAQEAARLLGDAGLPVTLHGAAYAMCEIYQRLGVRFGTLRAYRREDFHGPAALDLGQRGVLVAPPHVARSGFVTSFRDPLRIVLTGWGLLKDAKYRYGADHVLPLSDHADFDELLETVERVNPRKIYLHHGFVEEFTETLRQRGHDAEPARPDAQLRLFD